MTKTDKSEKRFTRIIFISGLSIIVLLLAIFLTLLIASIPSIKTFGVGFFISKHWDPTLEKFGALPFLCGTLITSVLALIISIPFSIAISIFL
ncbi:MAG TPA: hypothetical protein PK800_06110, partial [Syntrophorhabdaceae bacterium]|nr:hypothetical protein [Syntrophorhabdaceae bacterium]